MTRQTKRDTEQTLVMTVLIRREVDPQLFELLRAKAKGRVRAEALRLLAVRGVVAGAERPRAPEQVDVIPSAAPCAEAILSTVEAYDATSKP